jgi:hypothetical protein
MTMTTVLDKEQKRQVDISGTAYTVVIDPAGLRLVEKGKRKPVALLAWKEPYATANGPRDRRTQAARRQTPAGGAGFLAEQRAQGGGVFNGVAARGSAGTDR